MARRIAILDTTLRDGGRAPGFGMCLDEKLEVARHLARLGVDVIEAGRPAAGAEERTAVREIARLVRGPVIAAAARASGEEIEAAWEAVRGAERPRLHVMLGSSPERIERELGPGAGAAGAIEAAARAVERARGLCPEVEFSAADATRADPAFLRDLLAAAIAAGAGVVNVADTLGRALPEEFAALIRGLAAGVPGIAGATLSVHCHDDLGLATANSLAAVGAGAGQVECAVNGLGDRAGNAALEEVVMALATRRDILDAFAGVDTTRLYGSSRLVQAITGFRAQPHKAVVGDYALGREARGDAAAGSGSAGLVTPESVGRVAGAAAPGRPALGRRSGRKAFEERLGALGYELRPESLERLYGEFKALAERKGAVSDRDIEALALGEAARAPEAYRLERFVVNSGTGIAATGAVKLALPDGSSVERVAVGDGPVDAAFKAIDRIVGAKGVLERFAVDAVTEGRDAQVEARVRISSGGRRFNGRGLSTDIVEAGVLAYLAAMNSMAGETEAEYGADSVS